MPTKAKAANEQFPHLQPVDPGDNTASPENKQTLPEGFSFHECIGRVTVLDEKQNRHTEMGCVGYLLKVEPLEGIGRPMFCSTNASLKPREFSCTPVTDYNGKTAKQRLIATAHWIVDQRKKMAEQQKLAVREKKESKERVANYTPFDKDDRFEIAKRDK